MSSLKELRLRHRIGVQRDTIGSLQSELRSQALTIEIQRHLLEDAHMQHREIRFEPVDQGVSPGCVPRRATDGAAAFDLRAHSLAPDGTPYLHVLHPGDEVMIGTGWCWDPGEGVAGLLLPRSGLGARDGLVLANLVGLIDADYRGEIKVALWYRRLEGRPITISHGDRIAQLMPVNAVNGVPVLGDVSQTERGAGGFGSTGGA